MTTRTKPGSTGIRPFSNTPIMKWISARQATIGIAGAWLGSARLDAPLWFTVSLLVLTIALLVWLLMGAGHRPFLLATRRLHGQLRWFEADAITWFHPDQADELRAALGKAQVHVHELQGEAMHSIVDLQRELERRFGAPAWPKQPVARCLGMLERLPRQHPGVNAVVWHAADACLAGDAGAQELLSRWSRTMAQTTPHVLLFLGRPRPAPATATAAEPPVDTAVAVAAGPDDAWWKRRPGELVD